MSFTGSDTSPMVSPHPVHGMSHDRQSINGCPRDGCIYIMHMHISIHMYGCIYEWMDVWMDGWVGGWMTVDLTLSPPILKLLGVANNYQNSICTSPFKVSYPVAILTHAYKVTCARWPCTIIYYTKILAAA